MRRLFFIVWCGMAALVVNASHFVNGNDFAMTPGDGVGASRDSTHWDLQMMKFVFGQMEDDVVPYLTKNNRLDMMDFMVANMKAEVTNRLDGKSVMTDLTPTYIRIELSESCVMQIKSLPRNESGEICLLVAFTVDSIDSQLFLYNLNWYKFRDDLMPSLLGEELVSKGYMGSIILNSEDDTAVVSLSNPFMLPDENGQKPEMPAPFRVIWNMKSLNFVKE